MMAASFLIVTFCLVYDSYVTKGSIIDAVALKHFFRGWESVFITWWLLAFAHYSIIVLVFIAVKTNVKVWLPLYIIHQITLLYIGIN